MASCIKCGAPNPTVHITQISCGDMEKVDYCESCFKESEVYTKIKDQGTQETIKDALEALVRQRQAVFSAKSEEFISHDDRFSPEAHAFIRNSLDYAFRKYAIESSRSHVTARELIEACQDYATETWGAAAKSLLKSWGIKSSSDVGDIVFLLVDAGVLRKRPEGTREDFDGLPLME